MASQENANPRWRFHIVTWDACRFSRDAVAAANKFTEEYPQLGASPTVIPRKTLDDFRAWMAQPTEEYRGALQRWKTAKKWLDGTKSFTAPAVFCEDLSTGSDVAEKMKYVGGHEHFLTHIGILSGGKAYGTPKRIKVWNILWPLFSVIAVAHILLLYFLRVQPLEWRLSVHAPIAAALVVANENFSRN